jgi:hypothetical protein
MGQQYSDQWSNTVDVTRAFNVGLAKPLIGANNILNVYPDRQPANKVNALATDTVLTGAPGYSAAAYGLPTNGGYIYGTNSPFGFGGFYYTRIDFSF